MKLSDLISPHYLEEQILLHARPQGYGGKGKRWASTVLRITEQYDCRTVLDYGSGQGSLRLALAGRLPVREYDPAIPDASQLPEPADLVVATDVLEHIEPERIWSVMQHVSSLTRVALFAVVSLVPTGKRLSDGRQAHILLRSVEWWKTQMRAHDFWVAEELRIKPHKQWCAVMTRRRR